MLQQLPALVVLLAVLLQFGTMFAVGRARGKYGIKAPAISGHPDFERAYRVQMNTLEAVLLFLPTLWVAVHYGYGGWAGVAGLVWIVGRVWYALAYLQDAARRGGGFALGMVGWAATLLMALAGLVRALLVG
ncbi:MULTISPECIES: MAPEG family protein [Rhodanobacter]|uniref:MAPEG family protein n=1 Tax=Rhodanobacter hydrolyticus TaxID=2250595 RepID=A0ABW8J6M0_9GAMM|nr:MAPEG family protein [Rhodanobacter sp. 7MK24]MBD8879416.1 MAPEG family protein [Rhodanobacter sp. 7MK24]